MPSVVLMEDIYMPGTDQLTSASSEQIGLVLGASTFGSDIYESKWICCLIIQMLTEQHK